MSKMISDDAAKDLIEMAVNNGYVTSEQYEKILGVNKNSGQSIVSILFEKKYMDEYALARLVAESYGLNIQEINPNSINIEAQNKLHLSYIQSNNVFPFDILNNTLQVAICDQSKLNLEKNIKVITGMDVELILITTSNLEQLFAKAGLTPISTMEIGGLGTLKKLEEEQKELPVIQEKDLSEAEIFVNDILISAYKINSSDVHIESFRDKKRIRFRIDGILIEQKEFTKKINEKYQAVIAILKLKSGARIEEKRLPQDGAIQYRDTTGKIEFDLRVSFLPVQGQNERVVMRLLRKDSIQYDLDSLGFAKVDYSKLHESINATQGLILVTGPTGSGKTTTLYSVLNHLNDEKKNILTAEDPIEYELSGISQSQMKSDINYNFASALRTFLRQDPEIILVGEIRDKETGNIAVEASLTGHLVLSTLHTNDAVNTITRLVDMGIANYLVAATLTLVVAQRLPRRICKNCKTEDKDTSAEMLKQIGINGNQKIYKGKGCSKCNQTGYSGRKGIYEVLKVTPTIQDAILKGLTAPDIATVAKKEGYKSIQAQGIDLIKDGTLSFDEYRRTLFLS